MNNEPIKGLRKESKLPKMRKLKDANISILVLFVSPGSKKREKKMLNWKSIHRR